MATPDLEEKGTSLEPSGESTSVSPGASTAMDSLPELPTAAKPCELVG
ncbi:hypothetical protein BRADI_2g33275v3 [Brachypodium distachyon]|uniref:Uncharacterized protein n=1 Tax=Brachypodium distachyon TaxID=15368 RepID=A0A0Q3J329_BRADI|nr:hypothetical protein BRADI_2g33275v3 [Brachypodium distachyon]